MTDQLSELPTARPAVQPSRTVLFLLVAMTSLAPISLYLLVPALPTLAVTFSRDISVAQMTVSLFIVGFAFSQLIMGPLSDRFGRRPVLLAGLGVAVVASIGCMFAQTLPQLIGWRFLQALGGATGIVVGRAIVRDLYDRDRVGGMISLVIAVMMITQLLSPLAGGLLETGLGWRSILYALAGMSVALTAIIAVALPETRRIVEPAAQNGFLVDIRALLSSRTFIGYLLCQVLASALIFLFAGAGPYVVVNQMGRSSVEYGAWFATSGIAYLAGNLLSVRLSPRFGVDRMIWLGLALQFAGAVLNLIWGVLGFNQMPAWLFLTHMIAMFGNAFAMSNSVAGAISVRPLAAGTASGALGFLQMAVGALCMQFGAYLGGDFATTVPLNIGIVVLSVACASMMIFVVPRRHQAATPKDIRTAEEQDSGLH